MPDKKTILLICEDDGTMTVTYNTREQKLGKTEETEQWTRTYFRAD